MLFLVTNASGGLNPDYDVGTIVAMHDHLSLPTLGVRASLTHAHRLF
jgi:purine nucleoside phosphorylase